MLDNKERVERLIAAPNTTVYHTVTIDYECIKVYKYKYIPNSLSDIKIMLRIKIYRYRMYLYRMAMGRSRLVARRPLATCRLGSAASSGASRKPTLGCGFFRWRLASQLWWSRAQMLTKNFKNKNKF